MMKKVKLLMFSVLIVLCFSHVKAQFSKQQADNLVLNHILNDSLSYKDVYKLPEFKNSGSTILLYDYATVNLPYASNYIYFVDDLPFAGWSHPCRYIIVNTVNGDYTIVHHKKHPINLNTDYLTISQMPRPQISSVFESVTSSNNASPDNNLYAVLICGLDEDIYWRNTSVIYNTLIKVYGYKRENIFVLYNDGTTNYGTTNLDGDIYNISDFDYPAFKSSILATFSELAGETHNIAEIPELNSSNQLFVYVTDHGDTENNKSNICLPNGELLWDSELANYVKNIKCGSMIFMLQQCYSGGFTDDLLDFNTYNVACKNRTIHTSAMPTEQAYREQFLSGLKYSEFTFYWAAAARGHYFDFDRPWLNTYKTGEFPFRDYSEFEKHPLDFSPDLNNDNYTQMDEAFHYANYMDSHSPYGFMYVDGATYYLENPTNSKNNPFASDIFTLNGLAGDFVVVDNVNIDTRNYIIGGELKLKNIGNVSFAPSTNLYFANENAKITVEPAVTLTLGDNTKVYGGDNNSLQINGNLVTGNNVAFHKYESAFFFDGLYLNNTSGQSSFNNCTFNTTGIESKNSALTFESCNFNNCNTINSGKGNVSLIGSNFDNTNVNLKNIIKEGTPVVNPYVNVSNCAFNGSTNTNAAIELSYYGYYDVLNNQINGFYDGVQVNYADLSGVRQQTIADNEIYNCTKSGIVMYNSNGTVKNNNIYNNHIGLKILNNSNIKVIGNELAQNVTETQHIYDNSSVEVYASNTSFPVVFKYNAIVDEDNTGNRFGDPLLSAEELLKGTEENILDITLNYWGENFDPREDLPEDYEFYYLPTWRLEPQAVEGGEAEAMYSSAVTKMENQQYQESNTTFKQLINNYPNTIYAQNAVKVLFSLEEKLPNGNYHSLKNYYRNNQTIKNNKNLNSVADFFANKCDVKNQKWQEAIDWYENKITNPISFEDSLFAIIDLGNVYNLMNNTINKANINGKLPQYKFANETEYVANKNQLLTLIPKMENKKQISNINISNIKNGKLSQNFPNPFNEKTQIAFNIENDANVSIVVKDLSGKEVNVINQGVMSKGTHSVELSNSQLQPGMYFYSLIINGIVIDTKKLNVIK